MLLLDKLKNKFKGFTLTEVLLAVTIVGVIAALVLPATVSKFNDKVLNMAFTRNLESIKNAVNSLVVTENKTSFFETSMYYVGTGAPNYENYSGKFLKRNFKLSKYCGADWLSCFPETYYKLNGTKKEDFRPSYNGCSTAILRSGAIICIRPQLADETAVERRISGYIDVNGAKGPNMLDRDLRAFAIPLKTKHEDLVAVEDVKIQPNPLLAEEEEEETPTEPEIPEASLGVCDEDPWGLGCCTQKARENPTALGWTYSACCSHESIATTYPAQCGLYATITLSCGGDPVFDYSVENKNQVCQDCSLVVDNLPSGSTDKFVLDIAYVRTGWRDYGLGFATSFNDQQICVSEDLTGGSFKFTLRNETTMETLDSKSNSGGYAGQGSGNNLPSETTGGLTDPTQDTGGNEHQLQLNPDNGQQSLATPATSVSGLSYTYRGLTTNKAN